MEKKEEKNMVIFDEFDDNIVSAFEISIIQMDDIKMR